MSGSILLDVKPKKVKTFEGVELFVRDEENQTVIQGGHSVFIFKEDESIIWKMCDGKTKVKEIINYFAKRKNLPLEQIEREILKFIENLLSEKLIEI